MKSSILQAILKHAYVLDDIRTSIFLLKEFFEFHHFDSANESKTHTQTVEHFIAENSLSDERKRLLKVLVSENVGRDITKDNLYTLFTDLERELATLPSVVLHIAVRLGHEQRKRIGMWVREHVHEQAIVEIKHDPKSVGGCFITWNGNHHMFGLHHYVQKHYQDITNSIKEKYEQRTART